MLTLVALLAACGQSSTMAAESEPTTPPEPSTTATEPTADTATTTEDSSTTTSFEDEAPSFEPALGGYVTVADFGGPATALYPETPEGNGMSVELARQIGVRPTLCGEVPNPIVAWSGRLTLDVIVNTQVFYVQTATFDSESEALRNYEDLTTDYLRCHENRYLGAHDLPVHLEIVPVDTDLEAPLDQVTGYLVQDTNIRLVTYLGNRIGVVGSVLFITGTSDPDLADALADLTARRLLGESPPSPSWEPAPFELVPGYGSDSYWSDPDNGPRVVQDTPGHPAPVAEWLSTVRDDRLDDIASTACATFAQLSAQNLLDEQEAERLIKERFNYYEHQDYAEYELRLIISTLMTAYCPSVAELIPHLLGEVGES